MSELTKVQREVLERIQAAGYLYEGKLNALMCETLRRAGLIEKTHDPSSQNWTLTPAGRAALVSPAIQAPIENKGQNQS